MSHRMHEENLKLVEWSSKCHHYHKRILQILLFETVSTLLIHFHLQRLFWWNKKLKSKAKEISLLYALSDYATHTHTQRWIMKDFAERHEKSENLSEFAWRCLRWFQTNFAFSTRIWWRTNAAEAPKPTFRCESVMWCINNRIVRHQMSVMMWKSSQTSRQGRRKKERETSRSDGWKGIKIVNWILFISLALWIIHRHHLYSFLFSSAFSFLRLSIR